MSLSFLPLLSAGLIIGSVVGLVLGVLIGAVGGHFVWPTSCPEPEPVTYDEDPEGAYYRGLLTSCIGIARKLGVDAEGSVRDCASFMSDAIEADWFNELKPDAWVWPMPGPTPEPTGGFIG